MQECYCLSFSTHATYSNIADSDVDVNHLQCHQNGIAEVEMEDESASGSSEDEEEQQQEPATKAAISK